MADLVLMDILEILSLGGALKLIKDSQKNPDYAVTALKKYDNLISIIGLQTSDSNYYILGFSSKNTIVKNNIDIISIWSIIENIKLPEFCMWYSLPPLFNTVVDITLSGGADFIPDHWAFSGKHNNIEESLHRPVSFYRVEINKIFTDEKSCGIPFILNDDVIPALIKYFSID